MYSCHLLWCLLGNSCGVGLEHGSWDDLVVSVLANGIKGKGIRRDRSLYPGGLLWCLLGDGLGGGIEHDEDFL